MPSVPPNLPDGWPLKELGLAAFIVLYLWMDWDGSDARDKIREMLIESTLKQNTIMLESMQNQVDDLHAHLFQVSADRASRIEKRLAKEIERSAEKGSRIEGRIMDKLKTVDERTDKQRQQPQVE